jgi:hypothetical protein
MANDTDYPEHEKLKAIVDKSQAIGEFIEWLGYQGIHLAEYHKNGEWLQRTNMPIRNLLAEFFDIDQKKIDAEKDAMLEEQRRLNGV